MRGKRFTARREMNHEFELDLAPLLSVMVKLVPVLLISSAFVQIMTIESDLPGSLTKVIEQSHQQNVQIKMLAADDKNVTLVMTIDGKSEKMKVPAKDGVIDYQAVHANLVEVKKRYPQSFHLVLRAEGQVTYQETVSLMDEARKSKSDQIEFTYVDQEKPNEPQKTQWMFPEVMIEPSEAT
jgi:biopolymer transport protein ExbD